jgi:hypothetical protein
MIIVVLGFGDANGPAIKAFACLHVPARTLARLSAGKAYLCLRACPVIRQPSERLELHRLRSGSRQSGPIFANSLGKPLNMNNLLGRTILPIRGL